MDKEVEIVDEERKRKGGREWKREGEREDWVSKYLTLLWILSLFPIYFSNHIFFSLSPFPSEQKMYLPRYYACNSRLFVLPTKNSNLHNYTLHFNSMLLFLIEKSES